MKEPPPVTQYLISGVYLDLNVVTHYAVHQDYNPGASGSYKLTANQLKALFERPGISVFTWEWNYREGRFLKGQQVFIKKYNDVFYFYVLPDDWKTKNLRHLIKLNWF